MSKSNIAAGYVKALLDLSVKQGASRRTLIECSRINPVDLEDPDNRIPLASYLRLLRAAEELLQDPALSLKFGVAYSMPELSIVGLIAQSAQTMGEAFVQANRYVRLLVDAGETGGRDWFQLVKDDHGTWLTLTSDVYVKHPQLAESGFARCVSASARTTTGEPLVKAVHFIHAEPSYSAEYDRVFDVPVVFESDRNALLVDDDFLSTPIVPANRYAFGVFSERAEALLERLERSKTTKDRVQSQLIPVLHTGEIRMEQIAKKMGLSRRTLHRRLHEEGVTYKSLLDDLRHRMALHYLNGKKASIGEASYLVGFSDAAAFSRAFKRWTGKNPRAYLEARPDPATADPRLGGTGDGT